MTFQRIGKSHAKYNSQAAMKSGLQVEAGDVAPVDRARLEEGQEDHRRSAGSSTAHRGKSQTRLRDESRSKPGMKMRISKPQLMNSDIEADGCAPGRSYRSDEMTLREVEELGEIERRQDDVDRRRQGTSPASTPIPIVPPMWHASGAHRRAAGTTRWRSLEFRRCGRARWLRAPPGRSRGSTRGSSSLR